MSRTYRPIIALVGIFLLLGLIYASLPVIMAGLVKYALAERNFTDIEVKVGYPDWRGIRLHKLKFTTNAGAWQVVCESTDVDVSYHITDLLSGITERIQIPVAVVHIHPLAGATPAVGTNAELPLVALLSGQWLEKLPLQEVLLGQLSVEWRTSSDAVYQFQLSGTIRDAMAQLDGKVILPAPQQKQVAISLTARNNGQARLVLTRHDKDHDVMFEVAVDHVAIEAHQTMVNGILMVKLETLMPIVEPLLHGITRPLQLTGDFKSQWNAVIFTASIDNEAKMTPTSRSEKRSDWQVSGEAKVSELDGRWGEQTLPHGKLSARFETDPQQTTMHTIWQNPEQTVVLEAKGIHHFNTGNGQVDLELKPVKFSDSQFVLSQLFEAWPYPFDITRGRLSGTGLVEWQSITSSATSQQFEVKPRLVLHLDKLGGHYKKMTFMGLSTDLSLMNGKGVRTAKEAQLKLDLLDVGFPIENIVAHFQLVPHPKTQTFIMDVQKLTADLLGGKAHSEPFELDFGRDKNQMLVKLEQIRLNDIMQLEQQAGMQGTGVLDGQIPIEFSRGNIEVTQGTLSARSPGGTIRYQPTEKVSIMAKSNPSVKMVVDALSNFQYHVLNVNSDYKPDGNLSLQVHLEGENPDWQAGQPVHLNLNLDENIPALLRSLQLSGEITEQVRKRYEKSH